MLNVLHRFRTHDEDLFETRAAGNQIKMPSSRNADKEGHSADPVADALYRVILGIKFWRRGVRQKNLVQIVLSDILDGKGGETLSSCILTAIILSKH